MSQTRVILLAVTSFILGCGGKSTSTSHMKNEFSGSAFYYYDQADRVEILSQLQKAMTNNYSLRDIKRQRIGVDTTPLFESYIAEEGAISDSTTSPSQAASNLSFLDRVRKVIATYQDTHLGANPVIPAPVILNGIELREVGGHFYIVTMRRKLLDYAGAGSSVRDAYARLALGDEVIRIDGQPVETLLSQLVPYISGSTPAFRRLAATKSVTTRNFAFPEKAFNDYELATSSGESYSVRLPFFYQTGESVRADAKFLLETRGFQSLNELKLTWNEERKTWEYGEPIPTEGFDKWSQRPAGLVDSQEWVDQDFSHEMALRTGYIFKGGKVYGVAQLYTYMIGKMKNASTGEVVAFEDALKSFIRELKNSEIPLILDIRNNGGGLTNLPPKVLAAIGASGRTYPTFTGAYRVTRHIRQMMETYEPSPLSALPYSAERTAFEQLRIAIDNRATHTPAMDYTPKIESSVGYDQPVVVMITPNCISSCDITSMLMEASNRVTLLGTHSNGTGAGMTNEAQFTGAEWRDDFDVIKANIPNFLFGRPGSMELRIQGENSFYTLNSENVPVEAQVQYDYTLKDLLNGSEGWFAKAIELIEASH